MRIEGGARAASRGGSTGSCRGVGTHDRWPRDSLRPSGRRRRELIVRDRMKLLATFARGRHQTRVSPCVLPYSAERESHPPIQCQDRPTPSDQRAGRPGEQPEVVVAPPDDGPLRLARPRALGARGATRSPCSPASRRRSWSGSPATRTFVGRVRGRRRRPRPLPHAAALVPVALERRRAGVDRLLLARVRHHRGPAAVLRRPRHPRRRPPQVGQRPRRADRRRRPALPVRVLQAVAHPRRLAARGLPGARPRRAAARAPARGRRHAGHRHRRAARRPDARRARLARAGRPRAAAAARLERRGQRRGDPRRHRPALRRLGASTGCTRRCCSASAASGRCGSGRG